MTRKLAGILSATLTASLLLGIYGCDSDKSEITQASITTYLVGTDVLGDIVSVNTSDGTTAVILDTVDSGTGLDLDVVSAMVWVPSLGVFYAGTGGGIGAPNCNGCIYRIDPSTGDATRRTSASLTAAAPSSVQGMTLLPDNTILMWAGDLLYSLDPTTDEVTFLGNPICCGFGTTSSSDGTELFTGVNNNLYSVNPATAAATLVSAYTYTNFPATPSGSQTLVAMTTHPYNGTVYGVFHDGTGGTLRDLVTVDTVTAELIYIADLPDRTEGLTFVY